MTKEAKTPATELNEHDKKVLSKYTKSYTNFIESSTAKNTLLEDENSKDKSW